MRIEFEGDVYRVRFQHLSARYDGRTYLEPATNCSIWRGNGEFLGRAEPVLAGLPAAPRFNGDPAVVAVARCSLRDQFSRAVGRQVALGRATLRLFGRGPRRDAFLRAVAAHKV